MIEQKQQPKPTVEIYLPGDIVLESSRNTPIGDFLLSGAIPNDPPIVGAVVNNQLRELTYKISIDSHVTPVRMSDTDGMRFYRRTLTFLLETAFSMKFDQGYVTVDHSVSSGGYYCQVKNRPQLTSEEIAELEYLMHQLVEADIPFNRQEVPIDEGIEYFQKQGALDKVKLLKFRKKDYLTIYEFQGYIDYHHGYMLPSTGLLRWFSLAPVQGGFILRFPRRSSPTELVPIPEIPTLLRTFRQYGDWLELLGIASVGALNEAIEQNRINEVILVSEALHEQHISSIADEISSKKDIVNVVIIAGPSSSGKTTLSKRLSIQLLVRGISPFPLEMDNYFVNRDETPLDEYGNYDFESIDALDWNRLSEDINLLISGERVQLPNFNFITGKREVGDLIQLNPGEIIIIEGIHGLNPNIIHSIPEEKIIRIYASALTQLNLDRHNRVSTTDIRLIRRIVRDARSRGYSARETINRWDSVGNGEKKYIFPYQGHADLIFNSALVYEVASLKPLAEPLLRQVPFGNPEFIEAKRLLAFLEWFLPIDSNLVPDNSILKEFIGESILSQFKLWRK